MGLLCCVMAAAALSAVEFEWINRPRMHNPTESSVTLAAVPGIDVEIQVIWEGGHASRIETVRASGFFEYTVSDLDPGEVVEARVLAKLLGGLDWIDETVLTLRTLKPDRSSVRFAVAADTHAWSLYSRELATPIATEPYHQLQAALENMKIDPALDFAFILTDSAMTMCGSGCKAVTSPFGESSGADVDGLGDALTRYRAVWSSAMLGRVAAAHPVFVVNGDHEGEAGFHEESLVEWSRESRRATIPAMGQVPIPGPSGTLAYSVESGPVLIVVLDVNSATVRFPTTPEHWRLGEAQYEWLTEVLGCSRKPWKIVMAEHLLGGIADPDAKLWKGRGGITATDDGSPGGVFLGEQALAHTVMQAMGVDLFISAHDHVSAWGLKDGIAYLLAGRAGGVPHPWVNADWYRHAMDYDGDGVPEYETGITGTSVPGHLVLEADEKVLRIRYQRASLAPAENNTTVLEFVLEQ